MADINTPMTPGDHVLANTALCLHLDIITPAAGQTAMLKDILSRALIKSTGQNPFMRSLREAVQAWLNATQRDVVANANLRLALLAWARWRLGQAQAREEMA